jgi:hypothetical protein
MDYQRHPNLPYHYLTDSIPCGPRFRQVVHDSSKNQNADRFTAETGTTSNRILDRFQWNYRTKSTGIRTKPGF